MCQRAMPQRAGEHYEITTAGLNPIFQPQTGIIGTSVGIRAHTHEIPMAPQQIRIGRVEFGAAAIFVREIKHTADQAVAVCVETYVGHGPVVIGPAGDHTQPNPITIVSGSHGFQALFKPQQQGPMCELITGDVPVAGISI